MERFIIILAATVMVIAFGSFVIASIHSVYSLKNLKSSEKNRLRLEDLAIRFAEKRLDGTLSKDDEKLFCELERRLKN